MTLTEKLREECSLHPQHVVLRERRNELVRTLTCAEVYNTAVAIAAFLSENGVECDDKIAIVLENRVEWGCVYFAILLSGAIAVPLDPQSTVDDLIFFCHDSSCKFVFTSQALVAKVAKSVADVPSMKIIVFEGEQHNELLIPYQNAKSTSCEKIDFPKRTVDDVASILYTSGTTGKYKGVMLTHKNFYANYLSISQLAFPVQEQHFLALLPLHHSFPFMVTLIVPLLARGSVTYLDSFKSDDLLRCLQQDAITVLVGVPQLFYVLHKSIAMKLKQLVWFKRWPVMLLCEFAWWLRYVTNVNLSKLIFASLHKSFGKELGFLLNGGAKLDDGVVLAFLKWGFDFIEGYGLTETSPVVTFNCDKVHKLHSAGRAIFGVQIAIEREGERLIGVGADNSGEIVVKGQNVMAGYYQHQADTAAVVVNGWLHTGDIGYVDKEGYLYITGRQKDIIVLSSGKNISPEELELHYSKSKFVKEIAIVVDGSKMLEKLAAVVVVDTDYCKEIGKVDIYDTIKEELELLSKELPAYKRIMGFVILQDSLPRTRLGKLRRFLVQKKYAELAAGSSSSATVVKANAITSDEDLMLMALPLTQQILSLLQNTLKLRKTPMLSDHLELDLGVESLFRVELMVALEKMFRIKMADSDLSRVATVKELILLVAKICEQHGATDVTASLTVLPQQTIVWHDMLTKDLSTACQKTIALEFNWWQRQIFRLGSGVAWLLSRLMWRLQVTGLENLPCNEAFILAANHTSFLDGPILASSLPSIIHRKTYFIGLADFFVGTKLEKLTRIMKIVSVDPGTQLVRTMQLCAYILRHDKAICIFPEGARSVDGQIKEFKKGVGILVAELNVPVVPVYISGTYEAWPRNARLPRLHQVKVTFGAACKSQELLSMGKGLGIENDYAAIAKGIEEKVRRLAR